VTVTVPEGVVSDGTVKVVWVPALADPSTPTLTEVTAGTALDLSCFLTADGLTPGGDEQVITDERLCSKQTFEQPGRHTDTLSLKYVYDQQAAPSAADNEAFETLKHLTEGYIVERWGLDYDTDFAVGQIVDVKPVTCGKQMKLPPEANSKHKIDQRMFIRNTVHRDVAIVTGAS
jgi:hypothetical protein